jgi:hypothetical protein
MILICLIIILLIDFGKCVTFNYNVFEIKLLYFYIL